MRSAALEAVDDAQAALGREAPLGPISQVGLAEAARPLEASAGGSSLLDEISRTYILPAFRMFETLKDLQKTDENTHTQFQRQCV